MVKKPIVVFLFFLAALSGGVLVRYGAEQIVSPLSSQPAQVLVAGSELINSSTVAERDSSTEQKAATLLFVGDLMLSRAVGRQMEKRNDFAYPFRKIADTIREADFAFGNLEGPISSHGANQGSIYSFRARPEVLERLTRAGFDALSLANNHIFDWGRIALEDTIDLLKANGITPVGAGRNYEEANAPKIITVGDTKIALLAYTNLYPESLAAGDTSGISAFDVKKIGGSIRAAKANADIVAVSLHWGEEYEPHPRPYQREIAHALIDAGADLVIGHHPHVVQDVEHYISNAKSSEALTKEEARESYIFYSLGNFVFDQGFSEETMRGVIAEVIVQNKRIANVRIIPTRMTQTFQPEVIVP